MLQRRGSVAQQAIAITLSLVGQPPCHDKPTPNSIYRELLAHHAPSVFRKEKKGYYHCFAVEAITYSGDRNRLGEGHNWRDELNVYLLSSLGLILNLIFP